VNLLTEQRENKMGTWSENKLLLNMSVPIMISMLVQALYNVVDSYFVAQIPNGEQALAALTLAFPIQNLMIAVGVGIGVGMNALLSRSLGEKRQDKANLIAMQGIFLAFVCFVLFIAIGLFFSKPFIALQTTDPTTLAYGSEYLTICCVFSLGIFLQIIFERLLQATGRSVLSMVTQGVGAITNIILDPLLIFGKLGLPELGVAGAAYATIIGQIVAAIIGLLCNLWLNHDIHLQLRNLRPHLATIKKILFIGVPSIIMSSIGSVMTFTMNKILEPFASAVAVFGVYFKIQSFVFMPVFGLSNGMVPIIAYNLGARKRSRILKTFRLSAIYASSIMLLGLVIIQVFSPLILTLFNASPDMMALGVPAFRTISWSFVFAGVSIMMASVCQAVGKSVYSMLGSIGRQLVVLIPSAYLLSLTGDAKLIFWAFPLAEAVCFLLCLYFLRKVIRSFDF
jgi:putative MATE family efflux protein